MTLSNASLLADLQAKSTEITATLFSLPRIGPLEENAISVEDKTQFTQQLKHARNGLASIHQLLHATPEWYEPTAETNYGKSILNVALACIVHCRGWILARALTNDLPRVLLKKLDDHITPPLDSICFMLLYGSKLSTTDRCHVAHTILTLSANTMADEVLQHYRLVLQNFSDLPSAVRIQLMQGTPDKDKNGNLILPSLTNTFLSFVDRNGPSLAAWTTSDALLSLIFTGGSSAWTQLVTMLAFFAYQQSSETFTYWEHDILSGILNGMDITAIISIEAWAIVSRRLSIPHLQSTVLVLCKLLQRVYSVVPLRDRLAYLLGRLVTRLPTPEMSAILNELLAPLQTASHAYGGKLEETFGLFAYFPLASLSSTCQQLAAETIDKRATQVLDTLSMVVMDTKAHKKDIDAILALITPVNCLINIMDYVKTSITSKNTERVVKRIPQLLRECHACAIEQPGRLIEITKSIHALLLLSTTITEMTSTFACEILSFLVQWMTIDPTGLGKFYALRFAGNCSIIQFQDVEKIKAFNLLARIFTAAWQTTAIFIRHVAFTQFTRFATLTPHIDLTVRLAPAHIQEELANFMAKKAATCPEQDKTYYKDSSETVKELYWIFDLLGCTSNESTNLHSISAVMTIETNVSIPATARSISCNNASPLNPEESVTLESCLAASHIVRRYIRLMKKQTLEKADPTLMKSLLTLRRELDTLDVD
ncbi:hypothetical protein BDF19DRAFT_429524 [Syncephalis fuscata]|nr:hypothetical protein BDF19DRAFT_429524 [Syncephalis fuscata]